MMQRINTLLRVLSTEGVGTAIERVLNYNTRWILVKSTEKAKTKGDVLNSILLWRKIYYAWKVITKDMFVEDVWGGGWVKEFSQFKEKPYLYYEKYKRLIKELDKESIKEVEAFLKFLLMIDEEGGFVALGKKNLSWVCDLKQVNKFLNARFKGINLNTFFLSGLVYVPEIEIKKKEPLVVIDGGAYDGDTAEAFVDKLNVEKVYAFEPVESNYKRMLERVKNCKKIEPVKKALFNKETTVKLTESAGSSMINENGTEYAKTIPLDAFVKERKLKKVDVIKLDVEGSEYEVIEGAKETIKKYKPILLISLYHREKDFFEIKPMIEKIRSDYRFKIRRLMKGHFPPHIGEIMLIAY